MASSSNLKEVGSDKKCVESCNLRYGISEAFNQKVIEQQKVKAAKANITPQIFDDPLEQAKYNHIINDVLFKTFDDESEIKILRKSLEGMESNYQEIFTGKENHMFYCPEAFNFDSRIQVTETSIPTVLEEMETSLKAKQIQYPSSSSTQVRTTCTNVKPLSSQPPSTLTMLELANLKFIQNHLRKLRPQLAEQEFFDAFACFFYQHQGIFIHSLKLDEHLKVLADKAKLYRRQNKNVGFELTHLEKKLVEQFNISEQGLNDFADDITKHIQSNPKITSLQKISGRMIRKAIDEKSSGNDKMNTKKLFKVGKDYSIDEIKNGCKLGKLDTEIHFAGESDLLIMLPDSKLILSIEIKRHMEPIDSSSELNTKSKIDRHNKDASKQLRKNAEFISSRHGAILSSDWQFVKICAISPKLNNSEKICRNCQRFILTSDILNTPGGLAKWWEDSGLADRAKMFDQIEKDDAYNEFQMFFHRMVCLSSVRVVPDPFHTWHQVQAGNSLHMTAGHTKANETLKTQYETGNIDVKEAINSAHDAYKTLFFNRDQMALLANDSICNLIFMSDFGAGKSLISKEKAFQKAEKEKIQEEMGFKLKADPVFFLSLVGVEPYGSVDEYEYIFDIFTKNYDFLGSNVHVLSAQDLWAFYESKNVGANRYRFDIYFLVEYFVQHHSNGHFIIDECPLSMLVSASYDAKSVKRLTVFLTMCRQQLKNKQNLFWISLQSNLLADLSSVANDFDTAIVEMKEDMERNGWILPTLGANMRNQVNITNLKYEKYEKDATFNEMQSSITKLKSGTSLIGEIPILFNVRWSYWDIKKDKVLVHCIELMSQKSDKNIVVLWDNLYFQNVADDIKKAIKNKNVVVYPSEQSKEEGILNVKQFVEKNHHILVTQNRYFNGCESPNVVYINCEEAGLRNSALRGVQNFICIQLQTQYGHGVKINGVKEDNTFLS